MDTPEAPPEFRAAFYEASGSTLRAWVYVERTFVDYLEALLGVDVHRARLLWAQMPNFRARRELLASLAETYCHGGALITFRGHLRRAKTLSENRNDLAHAFADLDWKRNRVFFFQDRSGGEDGFQFLKRDKPVAIKNIAGWASAMAQLRNELIDELPHFRFSLVPSPKMFVGRLDGPIP